MREVSKRILFISVVLCDLSQSDGFTISSLALAVSEKFVEPFADGLSASFTQKNFLKSVASLPFLREFDNINIFQEDKAQLQENNNVVVEKSSYVANVGGRSRSIGNSAQSSKQSTLTSTPLLDLGIIKNKINEQKLANYQKQASKIASSFVPNEFKPVPWLSNRHLQTIAGVFVRDTPELNYIRNYDVFESMQAFWKLVTKPINYDLGDSYWDRREKIETPDDDWFHADFKFCKPGGERSSKGVAIILHGLESNSKSPLTRDIAEAHLANGLDVVCLNFRGCSGTPNDSLAGYHLGFTDDLVYFLDQLKRTYSGPIYLAGFSLGANVMIKALGELKHEAVEKYNIQGATALCSPLDVEQTYPMLQKPGITKIAYSNTLLKSLQQRTRDQLQIHCNGDVDTEEFDYKGAIEADTITQYDESFIAPIYGFDGAMDYYRKVSSTYFMEDVAVPFLILNAKDDPFLEPKDFPVEKSCENGGKAPVKMVHCKEGGHCGFIFQQLEKGEERPKTSWAPAEMGRFVEHIMQQNPDSGTESSFFSLSDTMNFVPSRPDNAAQQPMMADQQKEEKPVTASFVPYELSSPISWFSKNLQLGQNGDSIFFSETSPVLNGVGKALQDFVTDIRKTSLEFQTAAKRLSEEFKLASYQKKAAKVASSFVPNKFNPPFWLSNCHIQTIASVFVRSVPECSYLRNGWDIRESITAFQNYLKTNNNFNEEERFWDRRDKIPTPDGDWFHADYKFSRPQSSSSEDEEGENASKGTAIILHGLESNSKSPLVRDIAKAHLSQGLDVICLNFRGCSGAPNESLGGYHLGFTSDLKYFLDQLQMSQKSSSPIYLSGFSLGANVMIKTLGELGEEAVDKYNIKGATALGVPLDVEKSYKMLEKPGINTLAYTNSLLKSMKERAKFQLDLHCGGDPKTEKFDYNGAIEAKTIYDYENAVIAPIYGFRDPIDYYRQCSSVYFIDKVAVPLLILNAKDDPFFDPNYFPTEKSAERGGRAPVKMLRYDSGGHCGFVFHQLGKDEDEIPQVSWAPSEMGRFVQHIMQQG